MFVLLMVMGIMFGEVLLGDKGLAVLVFFGLTVSSGVLLIWV